jgi:hypothetical protein
MRGEIFGLKKYFFSPENLGRIVCPPSLFKKHKGIAYFKIPAEARGQRRASRNHKAVVFP